MKITIKHYFSGFQVLYIEAFYREDRKAEEKSLRGLTTIRVLNNPKTECEDYIDTLGPELLGILNSGNPLDNQRFARCITAMIALMESDIVMGRDFVGDEAKRQIKELFAKIEALNLDIDLSTGYFRHIREVYDYAKRW